jgi:glycosyltransferase involved in cell wall biosynthesis
LGSRWRWRICTHIGRLLHWKGFHLGLLAFAAANLADAEYWLLGEGAEQKNLQLLVEQLGIAKQVKFWGRLSREDTLSKLKECHVLVHPSLHDSGGLVCMEAMATSRPVICLDLGGPASQVTEETGFKIAAIDRDQTIGDIAEAMINLAKDSELRQRMGEAGRQLVREKHSWLSRGQQLAKLYEEIAKGDGILPDRTEEVQVSADLQEFF